MKSEASDIEKIKPTSLEQLDRKLQTQLVRQEHRFLALVRNYRKYKSSDDILFRDAAREALVWGSVRAAFRFLGMGGVGAGVGIGIYLAWQANELVEKQNALIVQQNDITSEQTEVLVKQTEINSAQIDEMKKARMASNMPDIFVVGRIIRLLVDLDAKTGNLRIGIKQGDQFIDLPEGRYPIELSNVGLGPANQVFVHWEYDVLKFYDLFRRAGLQEKIAVEKYNNSERRARPMFLHPYRPISEGLSSGPITRTAKVLKISSAQYPESTTEVALPSPYLTLMALWIHCHANLDLGERNFHVPPLRANIRYRDVEGNNYYKKFNVTFQFHSGNVVDTDVWEYGIFAMPLP